MKQKLNKLGNNTNRPLRIKALIRNTVLLSIVIASMGVLVSCKSAPETTPVIGKQQGLDEKIVNNKGGTNISEKTGQTVKDKITTGNITVNIDAKLQLPESPNIPSVKVVPQGFAQDTVDKVEKILMKGKQLHQDVQEITRRDFEQMGILAQALQNLGWWDNPENRNGIKYGGSKNDLKSGGTEVKPLASGKLKDVNEGDLKGNNGQVYKGFHGKTLDVVASLGAPYDAKLFVESSNSLKGTMIRFSNLDITSVYTYSKYTEKPRGMNMSLEDAKALASKTLNELGASDLKLAEVQLASLIPLSDKDDPNKTNQAYAMYFTRNVSGVQTTLDLTDEKPKDGQYEESYPYEQIFMIIDDSGIIQFNWRSPMKLTNTVADNTKILPFDQIMDIFKKQFFIHYASTDKSSQGNTYNIERITLGLMRVQVKDRKDEYMMIPVWDFFGNPSKETPNIVHDTMLGRWLDTNDHSNKSFLTINAVDGSIIDRRLGY